MDKFVFHSITNGDKTRINSSSNAMSTYGFTYEFHFFEKNTADRRRGCFDSHIELFKYAKERNMEYICINEDNIIHTDTSIPPHFQENITKLINEKRWNIIILGGIYHPFTMCQPTEYSIFYKTKSLHSTCCYIIHKRLYKRVLRSYEKHLDEHIDYYLMNEAQNEAYISMPFIFRRNNIIPTTVGFGNTNLFNSIVDLYYYVNCSSFMINVWESYAKYYTYILFIIIVLLCIYIKYTLFK
jgi:GR25 family glycosyltransferase involved in LPS biosynthesis